MTAAAPSGSSSSSTASPPSFLVLVIDLNPLPWTGSAAAATGILSTVLPPLLVFLNAHLALSHSNGVAVYACSSGGVGRLIYSTASHSRLSGYQDGREGEALHDASTYQHFALVGKALVQGVKRILAEVERSDVLNDGADESEEETALVKVLSMALNHLNRIHLDAPSTSTTTSSTDPLPPSRSTLASSGKNASALGSDSSASSSWDSRLLILSSTASASTQYIGLMNCIFAAQRRGIPIDVLKIFGEDTVFLQQATNLTGGIYFRLNKDDADTNGVAAPPAIDQQRLLQTLHTTYLPPPAYRNRLFHLPTLDEVDFRASCFCHGTIVDVGYVCGVCLSIFCHPPPKCFICNSRFPKRTLRRYENDLTAPRPPPAADAEEASGPSAVADAETESLAT
ncbi:unnamed protein product [Parajaminaea phylloscopi]